jgi:hypothetical protein
VVIDEELDGNVYPGRTMEMRLPKILKDENV